MSPTNQSVSERVMGTSSQIIFLTSKLCVVGFQENHLILRIPLILLLAWTTYDGFAAADAFENIVATLFNNLTVITEIFHIV